MNFDKTEIKSTLKDLEILQKETESLLNTINGPLKGNKKAATNVSATKKLKKIVNTSRQNKKLNNVSSSLELEKTQKLYGQNTFSRMTAEVFDDAPADLTPRQDFSKLKSKKNLENEETSVLKSIYTSEEKIRKLNFNDEKKRVNSRSDIFIPAPGITVSQVEKERQRLNTLEETARLQNFLLERKIEERKEYIGKDKAALKFQAAFRGHIGRQKVSLTKRLNELNSMHSFGEWIEIKDRESGDVWYYNTIHGTSQWDKPISMQDTLLKSKTLTLKEIPTVSDKRRSASSAPLVKNSKSVSFRSPEELKTIEDNENAIKECNKILGLQDLAPVENLTVPDGTFKPQLRKTILDAILTTRFDTISTVMSNESWTESQDAPFSKEKQTNPFEVSEKVDKSRPSLCAVVTINKSNKNLSKLNTDTDTSADNQEMEAVNKENLTLSEISHPGFNALSGEQQQTMCFGCWSAGLRRSCALHEGDSKLNPSQTMLLCRNWDLNVMRRRYRSEEIQEIFMKRSSSLRFDGKRRKFLTVTEHRHAIYRALYKQLALFNFRMILVTKSRRWCHSLLDYVRSGQAKPSAGKEISRIMRQKRTKQKGDQVRRYLRKIYRRLPIPPTTGYSYEERKGEIQYLFKHIDQAFGGEVELIKAFPTPKPSKLYLPRLQHLPIPRSIPMPNPEYSGNNLSSSAFGTKILPADSNASWLEQLCSSLGKDMSLLSMQQVSAITPLPGLELIRKSKYPPPSSIKFATFGRKPVPGLIAVGGLSAEFLVSQLVNTFIPSQYGGFMVMDKTPISPGISPEITIVFTSLVHPPVSQIFILRPVEHPMNYRRAPTITICSLVEKDNKYYYGRNRPDQTGEQEPHGFRTTTWARYLLTHIETDPTTFTPSNEIVSLNALASNRAKTTHVDLTYPFCEPSTKDNSSLEFYHLLLTGEFSPAKTQVFTVLTVQEPGEFLRNARQDTELGHLLVNVYRSWGFTQKDTIEQFMSDDGVPYWYHRRTGQTFWERPYYEEEKVLPLKGGSVQDLDHDEEPSLVHKGQEGAERRYNQGEFRKLMLQAHETQEQALARRQKAQASILVAKNKGLFPNPNESVIAHATSSADGLSVQYGVKDEMSAATAGNSSVSRTDLPNSPAKQIQDISNSMSKYPNSSSSQSGGFSPNQSVAPNERNNRSPIRGSALDRDDASLLMANNSNILHTQSAMNNIPGSANLPPSIMNGLGMDENIMTQLSVSIGQMLSNMSVQNNPQDMIKLGVGMGMAMMNSNIVSNMLGGNSATSNERRTENHSGHVQYDKNGISSDVHSNNLQNASNFPAVAESDYVDGKPIKRVLVTDPSDNPKHPIGIPDYRINETSAVKLSHKEEKKQLLNTAQTASVPLTALESAMDLKVVPLTETPDERSEKILVVSLPKNADEAVAKDIPLLIYPELSTHTVGGAPPNSTTHEAAGIGTAHVISDNGTDQLFVKGTEHQIRKAVMPLPVGFFGAIVARHIGKQMVDYLPQVPNLPIARTVGRVKPRSTAVDWIAIGFDPWSAGRSPLNSEFIPSLSSKADKLFKGGANNADEALENLRKTTIKDAFLSVEDTEGLVKDKVEISKNQVMAEDFKKLCSLVRHAKFIDAEELLNQADWNVPIDYQDEQGNTILHIGSQNGSKRLIKLCLRRGAYLDVQNLNGQTALHFAFGYGYTDVGEYLVSKGANDSILNKDNLTCYEGLGARELALL